MGIRWEAAIGVRSAAGLAVAATACGGAISNGADSEGDGADRGDSVSDSPGPLQDQTAASDVESPVDATLDVTDASAASAADATLEGIAEANEGLMVDAPPDEDGGGWDGAIDAAAICGAYSPAEATPGACNGTVTFELGLAPGLWQLYGGFDTSSPPFQWLTVACPSGTPLPMLIAGNVSFVDCSTCAATLGEAIGFSVTTVGTDGGPSSMRGTWGGVFFTQGTCGSPATRCTSEQCAPPGRYVATMCACPVTSPVYSPNNCLPSDFQCVHVPFDYPTSATISGTLTDLDAGGDP